MILIISFRSSSEIDKGNPFLAFTAPSPIIFLSNLFIAFEIVKLLTNPGTLSLAERIAIFVRAFFPKLPNQEPKDLLDWIILDIFRHLFSSLFLHFLDKVNLVSLFFF